MIRFDDALIGYVRVLEDLRAGPLSACGAIVVVRDLFGRLHLALERRPENYDLDALLVALDGVAGAFHSRDVFISEEMVSASAVFESADLQHLTDGIQLLERVTMGAEWGRAPLENVEPRPPRATLFGIKGGVGRSTALAAWSRYLASRGERVLVVDLDLESPGVSTSILAPGTGPDYGIVDWLVEDAVNQADDELSRLMVARSPLATGTRGEVLIAPCDGTRSSDYIAKLSRAYVDARRPDGSVAKFSDRLAQMIDALELEHKPSVVLIDSRAGLHDLGAIATTRLGAMSFLFAAGTAQTWAGYSLLLKAWARRPRVASEVRDRIRIVAAQIPETGRDSYEARFRQESYDLFAMTLYEEASEVNPNAFNFDISARDAPHHPLRTYFSRALQDWDPLANDVTDDQVMAALGDFLHGATELVIDDSQ